MAIEVEKILQSHLVSGIVSIPVGTFSCLFNRNLIKNSQIKFIEGASNNLPDEQSENAAIQITEMVKKLTKNDLVIVLISGGGSALLPFPKPPITLQEKCNLIKLLSSGGADIVELNCVRKRLSVLKGGGLASLAHPAEVVSLILSDVIGDPLDFIASGPTVPNKDSSDSVFKILEKYSVNKKLPDSIKEVLDASEVKISDFSHVTNFVIGSNKLAAREAAEVASKLGYQTSVISLAVRGDVALISHVYARIAIQVAKVMKGLSSKDDLQNCLYDLKSTITIPEEAIKEMMLLNYKANTLCLIFAGEPTVVVRGSGQGGRNQQLALQFGIDIDYIVQNLNEDIKRMNILLLSAGTDGNDGPTDAAGALGFLKLSNQALQLNLDPVDYVNRNDSYNFYKQFLDKKFLIETGLTGTNVMDIHILIISQ